MCHTTECVEDRVKKLVGSAWLIIGLCLASDASAQTIQQLRVQWDAYPAAAPAIAQPPSVQATGSFRVVQRRSIAGTLVRQRDPELSENHLLVRAVNAGGEIIDTQLLLDPRVIRAEAPGPSGDLRGETLHLTSPEFLLTLPDGADVSELRVYHPRWTGTAFLLDLLGTISLN
jgi:hypothetical protein